MKPRAVFDTNTVVSALLFASGHLAWLRNHWANKGSTPLISQATAAELYRVLAYPKFRLNPEERVELLGDYLPYCETIEVGEKCPQHCRDPRDQPFLDLAQSGNADVLISGDKDLLALADRTRFSIESPDRYRFRLSRI